MPTMKILPKASVASPTAFVWTLARWLINDLPGQAGPGWTLIQAYDADNAGDKRRVPTAGQEGSMSNDAFAVGGDFGWYIDTLGVGDWIVLRSGIAATGNQFELLIKLINATTVHLKLIPLDDFDIAGADPAAPTLPATSVGYGSAVVTLTFPSSGSMDLSLVGDESVLTFLVDQGAASKRFGYVGEVDGARTGGTPPDDRPFVIHWDCAYPSLYSRQRFSRLSPRDSTTILSTGSFAEVHNASGSIHNSAGNEGDYLSTWNILPLGVAFPNAPDAHFAGWLRYLGTVSVNQALSGTMNNMSWMFFADSAYGKIAMQWDGATAY